MSTRTFTHRTSPAPHLACWRVSARTRRREGSRVLGLALAPRPCHPRGMDTSTTPYISPALDPESMAALMLRYVEDYEELAHLYARALFCRLSADVGPYKVTQLARDIVTEVTNDIREFEGEAVASRIGVALRRLIDRVVADEEFMTMLAD